MACPIKRLVIASISKRDSQGRCWEVGGGQGGGQLLGKCRRQGTLFESFTSSIWHQRMRVSLSLSVWWCGFRKQQMCGHWLWVNSYLFVGWKLTTGHELTVGCKNARIKGLYSSYEYDQHRETSVMNMVIPSLHLDYTVNGHTIWDVASAHSFQTFETFQTFGWTLPRVFIYMDITHYT